MEDANSPPLIAHVIYSLGIGGLENGLVNLINRMPADRYRHAIICLKGSTNFSQRIKRSDVQIFELHKKKVRIGLLSLRLIVYLKNSALQLFIRVI